MGNIILTALTKAERLAHYRAIHSAKGASEVVSTLVNSSDDVAKQARKLQRKAKYNSQFESSPCTDMFIKETTTSPIGITQRTQPASINTVVTKATSIAPVKLAPNEMKFFSENLSGVKQADIEQAIGEIFAIRNIEGLTGFTKKLGHKSAYSTRAMLEARFKDPQRYNEILTLANLNKQGKIKYFPRFVMPNGKTNPLVKQDMEAILSGRNYFEQFTTANTKEILAKTKVGDAFSIGDKMFVRDMNGYVPLKMDKQTYQLLFPPVDRYAMAQGNSLNCGVIATINNLVQVPTNRVKMYQMFEQQGNRVSVSAIGKPSDRTVFDLNNLRNLDDGILSDTGYGLKMLECKGAINRNGEKSLDAPSINDTNFCAALNALPIEHPTYSPLDINCALSNVFSPTRSRDVLTTAQNELKLLGKGRTLVSGGGGDYSLGTGNSHFISAYDFQNGNVIFANPNATADFQIVPVEKFVTDYMGKSIFQKLL